MFPVNVPIATWLLTFLRFMNQRDIQRHKPERIRQTMQGGDKMTFPLVISWFLTFGYVPEMTDAVQGKTAEIDGGHLTRC